MVIQNLLSFTAITQANLEDPHMLSIALATILKKVIETNRTYGKSQVETSLCIKVMRTRLGNPEEASITPDGRYQLLHQLVGRLLYHQGLGHMVKTKLTKWELASAIDDEVGS